MTDFPASRVVDDPSSTDGHGLTRATIRDIAAISGVSIATVSRVLNGHPDVSTSTRERVLQTIRDTNYSMNRTARGLVAGRTGLIGLTLPFVYGDYFAQIVSGAAEALYERDLRFVVCPTAHEHERELTLLDRLMHGTTDGALLLLPTETEAELDQLQRHGYPFVIIDPRWPLPEGIPVVAAAHWSGAKVATEHLIGLGHRRIAAITGTAGWCATIDRLAGFQAALFAARISVPSSYVREGDYQITSGEEIGRELLSRSDRPTAIFSFNDNMAIGVMKAARQLGIRIPDDVSLVGFDDADMATIVDPALTTIRQPLQELGRVAAGLLCRILDGQRIDALRIELSTRLIVRQTTAPPANAT